MKTYECEECGHSLSWIEDSFGHEFGREKFDAVDPCPRGCCEESRTAFKMMPEYEALRLAIKDRLTSYSSVAIELTNTMRSLDECLSEWWDNDGSQAFVGENS